LYTGQRGSEVNFHENDTVAFNYLSKHMRDMMTEHNNNIIGLKRNEQMILFDNVLSSFPFYNMIKNHIPHPKWSSAKGIEYFSISSKVGMDVFREIVSFIVSDGDHKFKQSHIGNNPK